MREEAVCVLLASMRLISGCSVSAEMTATGL